MLLHHMPQVWEQRWHPFRGEWVLFTSHRGGRPWIGETVQPVADSAPAYDPTCALCPGNPRLHGSNPPYTSAYVFTNDLPCFSSESRHQETGDTLYRARPALGTAEVVCYHPHHNKTFADLTTAEATAVVQLWKERYEVLGARPEVDHVLIFENKGAQVGTSNPHPHCQIYASNMIYALTARESEIARAFYRETGQYLAQAVLERESRGPRVIAQNDHFLACVPWFARYAYEVHVLPRRPMASLADLQPAEVASLAAILLEVTIRYDNLWRMPMPYVMAFHQAPTDGADHSTHPFHIEFHPPLRNPTTLKYLAGPEIGGGSMTNESDPDEKAAELQATSPILYRRQPPS